MCSKHRWREFGHWGNPPETIVFIALIAGTSALGRHQQICPEFFGTGEGNWTGQTCPEGQSQSATGPSLYLAQETVQCGQSGSGFLSRGSGRAGFGVDHGL